MHLKMPLELYELMKFENSLNPVIKRGYFGLQLTILTSRLMRKIKKNIFFSI